MDGLECQSCGARVEIAPDQRTGKCLYCASPQIVERPPRPDRPSPTFAIGFVVLPARAKEMATRWARRAWLAPEAFRRAAIDDIRGLYVPAYLYTAAAASTFDADIGENYTVTETYRDSKGNTRTRTRTETEWHSLGGTHTAYVADRVVTASRGIPNDELEAIEPFDLRALHRFTPKIISGWTAEEATLAPPDVIEVARSEAREGIARDLSQFMPGDKHRSLRFATNLQQEDLELLLLPVWVLPVRYQDRLVRLLVNGQTGKVFGKAPTSWLKVTALVLLVLGLIGAVTAFFVMRSR